MPATASRRSDGQRIFVPFTLPGETVEIERDGARARLVDVVEPSADRVTPACRHFGTCGGCALQHMDEHRLSRLEAGDRAALLAAAPHRRATVEPVVATPPGTRRRAIFSAVPCQGPPGPRLSPPRRARDRRGSRSARCSPRDIVAALPLIRSDRRPRGRASAVRRASRSPPATGSTSPSTAAASSIATALEELGRFAREQAIARLTVDGTEVFVNRRPEIAAGGAALLPLAGRLRAGLGAAPKRPWPKRSSPMSATRRRSPISSAGIGTFALRLARRAAVTAVEGDPSSAGALDQAVRQARGLKPVTTLRRDLFANPLAPAELDRFGAVVFDPPAAGAKAQSEAIAQSRVPKVVAVSCNPATLGRDARILVDGGYRLTRVLPVDQFLWSAEIEVVATFVETLSD